MTTRAMWVGSICALVVCMGAIVLTMRMTTPNLQPSPSAPLSFSTSQKWDPALLPMADRALTTQVPATAVSLPPPPTHESEEIRAELDTLRALIRARTTSVAEAIIAERDIRTADIGGIIVADLVEPATPTALSALVTYGWDDLITLIMREKRHFDRARPHMADARITPLIEVPSHPAYPSGHSSQAHYLARILGLVYPDSASALMLRAEEIAIHREVAGVHYPSDTEAGALLAEQFVNALLIDPAFQELLLAAQREAAQ